VASQGSSPAGNPPPDSPPGDGEAGRIKTIDSRFTALEEEQRKQGGILERIERALGGGAAPASQPDPPAGTGGDTAPAWAGSIAEQVRRGVEEIQAKQRADAEAAEAATKEQAWRQSIEDRLAERRPTEPATGVKNRIQRALFGKQDQR
jgi:hypothetical protein